MAGPNLGQMPAASQIGLPKKPAGKVGIKKPARSAREALMSGLKGG